MARFDGVTGGYLTQHSLQKTPRLHIVDLHFAGLLAHACAPNVVLGMTRQNLHALRAIRPGDMLTIDYEATEDELFAPFVCGCGSPDCRKFIVGGRARRRSQNSAPAARLTNGASASPSQSQAERQVLSRPNGPDQILAD